MTEETAVQALREHDWSTVQSHVLRLLDVERTRGIEWLERLEAEASVAAVAGDKYAQSVMGGIETWRSTLLLAPAGESLERALDWFMMAARQVGGEPMIDQVRFWYQKAQESGLRLVAVETFLADPETQERYRKYAEGP